MDLYEKIKELASQKNVSIRQVEEKLGFANGTIRQWGKKNPGINKLKTLRNISTFQLIFYLVWMIIKERKNLLTWRILLMIIK